MVNQAVEDLRLGQYINAAMHHIEEATTQVIQYCTLTCQECGTSACIHSLRYMGYVLVGCEGYWHINPEALGLQHTQWSDWRILEGGTYRQPRLRG